MNIRDAFERSALAIGITTSLLSLCGMYEQTKLPMAERPNYKIEQGLGEREISLTATYGIYLIGESMMVYSAMLQRRRREAEMITIPREELFLGD